MAATSAQGALLLLEANTIAEVQSANFSISRGTIETSSIDDAVDTAKTFIAAGLYDLGELSMDVMYDAADSDHKAIIDNLEDGVTDGAGKWTVTVPDSGGTSNYVFDGFVTAWDVTLALEDVVKASVTIKLTGGTNESIPST